MKTTYFYQTWNIFILYFFIPSSMLVTLPPLQQYSKSEQQNS